MATREERERALGRSPSASARTSPRVRTSSFSRSTSSRRRLPARSWRRHTRAGARYVSLLYWDQHAKRSRLEHATEDSLGFIPEWYDKHFEECIERRGAYFVVWGDPNPTLLDEVGSRGGRRPHAPLAEGFELVGGGEVNWSMVPRALRGLGRAALRRARSRPALGRDRTGRPPGRAGSRTRLGRARGAPPGAGAPARGTRFHGGALHRPGTDLTVGTIEGGRWLSGGIATSWGRSCSVNTLTEEVFTTPDWRRVEGTVAATLPVQIVGGSIVEGLRLRFRDGRAVEITADTNEEAIRAQMSSDEGAARLGEVALVDGSSPVGKSGLVVGDVPIDENATCHIAWGAAYPFTVDALPEDEAGQDAIGFNRSQVHQDDDRRDRRRRRRGRAQRCRGADHPRRRLVLS